MSKGNQSQGITEKWSSLNDTVTSESPTNKESYFNNGAKSQNHAIKKSQRSSNNTSACPRLEASSDTVNTGDEVNDYKWVERELDMRER